MSEQSDAVILVVSEESGAISIAFDGKIYYDHPPIEVTRKLRELLDRTSRRGEGDTVLPELSEEIPLKTDANGGKE